MSVCFCPTSEGRTLLCFTFLSLPSQTEQLRTLAFRWAAGDVNNNRTQSTTPNTSLYLLLACMLFSKWEGEDVMLQSQCWRCLIKTPARLHQTPANNLIPRWLYVQQACEVLVRSRAIYRAVSLPSPGLWPWRECDKWQAAFQPFQQWQQVGGGEKKIMPSARAYFCLPVKYHFSLPRESLTATAVPGSRA